MEIMVRRAQESDADALTDFNIRLAAETENFILDPATVAAGVRAMLAKPEHGVYWVAERGGEVIACLGVTYEWSDWRNGAFWWIQSVYVRAEFRRQGIFRRLHQTVLDEARRDPGVCGCRLYVEKENRTAQATYEALGMESHYHVYETPDFLKG